MNTLPPELVSLLGSSLFGSTVRLLSFSVMARHKERLLKICRARIQEQSIAAARNHTGIQLTRRVIALIAVFSVILLPKLLAIFRPDIPIAIGYNQFSDGFLFFSSTNPKVHWSQFHGLVITPLDTHLLSAIIGLYFGSALVEMRG